MKIAEIITEGITPIWGRKGGRMARRYRCTTGVRTGRIVADPATCSKPKDLKKSFRFKATKLRRGSAMRIKAGRTKRATISRSVKKANIRHKSQKIKPFRPSKRKPIK
jgi:hypothetical protein